MVDKLEELTVKELQAEAVKLGIPEDDSKLFTTKAPLIATINTLKATKASQKVETLNPLPSAKEEKQVEKQWKSKADKMRAILMEQPKIRILVPLEGKETQGIVKWVYNDRTGQEEQVYVSGAVQPVTLNGFQYLVPKGIYTDVPEQVAQVIQDKYQQTEEAGKELLIDRIDPETGRPVRDQL